MRLLILSLLLAACSSVQEREVDGIPYVLHLDQESPCGALKFNEGCTVTPSDGMAHVYISSDAPQWVVDHEIEHVRGMRHSQWRNTTRGFCCFVFDAGMSKKYERGDTLCNVNGEERIIRL